MLKRTLGRTGIEVSALGFGAEPIGRRGVSAGTAANLLNALLDEGINVIDTASAYGDSEDYIGRALAHRRDEFTLVTKCGWTDDWQPARSPRQLAASIDRSLQRLRVDSVDVLLLHGSPLDELKTGEAIAALEKARKQGKTRFIGISDDNETLAYSVGLEVFDVIETTFNICDQANARTIVEADRRRLGVLIKRTIANAVPGRTAKPARPYARQYWPRWQTMNIDKSAIGDLPWLETALRFATFAPGAHCALVGSASLEHIRRNIRSAEKGPLDHSAVNLLQRAFLNTGKTWPALR
ncbi:MAG: aldo/keto reductase [Phycisphaerales bacterium]|nr:MAG: aldo/keto reductase [Phycisphaerales bacterium]